MKIKPIETTLVLFGKEIVDGVLKDTQVPYKRNIDNTELVEKINEIIKHINNLEDNVFN